MLLAAVGVTWLVLAGAGGPLLALWIRAAAGRRSADGTAEPSPPLYPSDVLAHRPAPGDADLSAAGEQPGP